MDYKRVFVKFGKGALSGGLSAVTALLVLGVTISSVNDIKKVGITFLSAFVGGAYHSVVELYKQSQLQ